MVRANRLTFAVMSLSAHARVENQSAFNASLVAGQKPNHVLHAILTIFTCLIWGIVWIIVSATTREVRQVVMVDDYGRVYLSTGGGPWVQQPQFEV